MYAGYPACDVHPWGAYAVGAIFQEALINSASTPDEKRILQVMAIDSYSRLIGIKRRDLLDGKYGEPDMTSGNLK
jgi:hypothetical protein